MRSTLRNSVYAHHTAYPTVGEIRLAARRISGQWSGEEKARRRVNLQEIVCKMLASSQHINR
jgi:hypothetical protein